MKPTQEKNFVDKRTIKLFDEINGLKVIEEYLLYKGTDHVRNSRLVHISHLEKMAHIEYELKVNATNKLYVGWYLDRYFRHNDLFGKDGYVKIPTDIFERVDALHKQFKTHDNQMEE